MKKQIIIATLSVALLSVGTIAFADTTTTPTTTTTTQTQTRKDCVLSAISTRNTALQLARDAFKIAQATALQTRKDALAAAKSLTDKTAKKAAVKTANDNYKASIKQNRNTLSVATKLARDAYKTTAAACPKA